MKISPGEIHVWFAEDESIADADLLRRYASILSAEETQRQKRFFQEKHRHQYLVTRAMVRTVLSLYAQEISPDQWRFSENEFGKPFVSNLPLSLPLSFNISHSEKMVVMAFTLSCQIGVDVEYLLRGGNTLEIAESFFAPSEIQDLFSLPPKSRQERFYDLWTLGEAYIKACGMGLSIPLDHFSYSFPQPGKISISFLPERNDHPEYWQFWQIRPNDTHKASLALKSDIKNDSHLIRMRKIIPLCEFTEVDYPIVMENSSADQAKNSTNNINWRKNYDERKSL